MSENGSNRKQQTSLLSFLTPSKAPPPRRQLSFSDDENSISSTHPPSLDIGRYIQPTEVPLDDNLKYKLLQTPWTPARSYDFKSDMGCGIDERPTFNAKWLARFYWMAYSKLAKGALCRYCVLFRPSQFGQTNQKAFITQPCINYSKFVTVASKHESSQAHREAKEMAANFCTSMSTKRQDVTKEWLQEHIIEVSTSISGIWLNGAQRAIASIPTNGAQRVSPFETLCTDEMRLRIIAKCKQILLEHHIVPEIKESAAYSLLVGQTVDMRGTPYLAIGIRYVSLKEKLTLREEFLGFLHIADSSGEALALAIERTLRSYDIDMSKMVGVASSGGCAENVHKHIKAHHPKALFFHSLHHNLNAVVNEGCSVMPIRNTFASIIQIIEFFRESSLRRRSLPNLSLFNEPTVERQIDEFQENFVPIAKALKHLAESFFEDRTRLLAYQLHCTATSVEFIVCVHTIAIYSTEIERIAKKFHQRNYKFADILRDIVKLVESIQACATDGFDEMVDQTRIVWNELGNGDDLQIDTSQLLEEIFKPYLDSLCKSLHARFSRDHLAAFSLPSLHPRYFHQTPREDFEKIAIIIRNFYNIRLPSFRTQTTAWYDYWQSKPDDVTSLTYEDLLRESSNSTNFSSVFKALQINLVFDLTANMEEFTVRTMPLVDEWLLQTRPRERTEERCTLAVHRGRLEGDSEAILKRVTDELQMDDDFLKMLQKQLFAKYIE